MILEVQHLNLFLKNNNKNITILQDISFSLRKNTCLGILGESGSGKSMLIKAILGLLDENFRIEGTINFNNTPFLPMNHKEKRLILGSKITTIVQNPMTAFDPLFTIGNQIIETFFTHKKMNKNEAMSLAIAVLYRVQIHKPKEVLKKYPHELSGGQLQRIMIGIAIALEPVLLIADEPTTAIDSLNEFEIIKEFQTLKKELGISMIFITHDLCVMSHIADEILVIKDGEIVEKNIAKQIIENPQTHVSKLLVETRTKLLKKFQECTRTGDAIRS